MRILTDVPLPATEDNVEFIECPPPRPVLRVFSVQNKISYQALLQKNECIDWHFQQVIQQIAR